MTSSPFRRRRRAFVSSTTLDLSATRYRVAESLRSVGLDVLPMEDFPALAEDAAGGSAAMVLRCDVFVGIYARRYGTRTADNRSVTEVEYATASERRLPRLCFLLTPDAAWPPELTEDGPAASALGQFLARVRSDVVVKEWRTEPDLLASVRASAEQYLGLEQRRRRRRILALAAGTLFMAFVVMLMILGATARPELHPVANIAPPGTADATALAVDPGRQDWALGDSQGRVFVGPFGARAFVRHHSVGERIRGLAWLPEGLVLAISDHGLTRISPEKGVLVRDTGFQAEGTVTFTYDPRTSRVAVGGREGSVSVTDLRQGNLPVHLSPPPTARFGLSLSQFGMVRSLAFSPDGTRLAVAWINGVFAVLDLQRHEFQRLPTGPDEVRGGTAIGFADRTTLVYSAQSPTATGTVFVDGAAFRSRTGAGSGGQPLLAD